MKGIKRLSYVLLFIISLFIINSKISALSLEEVNEEFIYENLVSQIDEKYEEFDFNIYNNVFCIFNNNGILTCRFFSDENSNKFTLYIQTTFLYFNQLEDFSFYYIRCNDISNCSIDLRTDRPSGMSLSTYTFFSNTHIDEIPDVNVLDFSSYLSPEEEKEELEITNKATTLLNFMIDKTKNIYEVLINNQIFLLCIGILISYLIFMFLLRLRK